MTERIAIVGSRVWGKRWAEVKAAVEAFIASLPADAVVVTGGAQGVDLAAQIAAERRGLAVVVHLPDWARDGNAAGFIRNKRIVESADRVVAWHNQGSKGTESTIEIARRAGKPVEVRT